jgi:hypothetical protein
MAGTKRVPVGRVWVGKTFDRNVVRESSRDLHGDRDLMSVLKRTARHSEHDLHRPFVSNAGGGLLRADSYASNDACFHRSPNTQL